MLAFLIVFSSIFSLMSCDGDNENENETTVSTTTSTTESTTAATTAATTGGGNQKPNPTDLYEDVPVGNYNGYVFKILNNISAYACTTIVPTVTEDSVNQAMFLRNSCIKDKLGINVIEERMPYNDIITEVQKINSGGDFIYDVVYNEVHCQATAIQSGAYHSVDVYDEYLNLSKPWWFTDAMESLEINGKGFELLGDLQLGYYDSVWAMAFNNEILLDKGQPYPYELVRKGEWTIDALKNIISETAKEGSDEIYGLSSQKEWMVAMFSASNFALIEQDRNGSVKMYDDDNTFTNIYNAIMNNFLLSNGEEGVNYVIAEYNTDSGKNNFPNASTDENWSFQKVFLDGKSAFMAGMIGDIQMVRSATFNYGILPMPKYNKTQEQYVSYAYMGAASCGIPSTTPDYSLERTCTILENLAAYSHKLVKSEYYDVVVQTRTIRDNDSLEMLDVIFGHHDEIASTVRFEIDSIHGIGISNNIKLKMSDRLPTSISKGEVNNKLNALMEKYQ